MFKRLDVRQLVEYLTASPLVPEFQYANRTHHSTEMTVLKMHGGILRAVDSGDLVGLMPLDLSAAFNTFDHATLLRRLLVYFCIDLGGAVINWFTSYLVCRLCRTMYVQCGLFSLQILPVLIVRRSAGIGPWADTISAIHDTATLVLISASSTPDPERTYCCRLG